MLSYFICILLNIFPLLIGREELLTEHVMAWNQQKILNFPESLSKRYLKVVVNCSVVCQMSAWIEIGRMSNLISILFTLEITVVSISANNKRKRMLCFIFLLRTGKIVHHVTNTAFLN